MLLLLIGLDRTSERDLHPASARGQDHPVCENLLDRAPVRQAAADGDQPTAEQRHRCTAPQDSLQNVPQDTDIVKKSLDQISQSVSQIKQKIEQQSAQQSVETVDEAKQLNARGLQFARNKQPFDALDMFRQAIVKADDKTNYCLNAAQIILEHRDLKNKADLLVEAAEYLTRSIRIDADDVRWKRYQKLLATLNQRRAANV